MWIVQGLPPLGKVKQWWGGENNLFCSQMCKYLENCTRYDQSLCYYLWL